MEKKYIVGVDLGGTNIRAALFDFDGKIVSKSKASTGKDPLQVLFKLLESVYAPNARDVAGIGIAAAGLVDRSKGIVIKSPNIPKLDGVNLKAEIGKHYKARIV